MIYAQGLKTSAFSVVCALGIGIVMQSTETAEKRYGKREYLAAGTTAKDNVLLNMDEITLVAAGANVLGDRSFSGSGLSRSEFAPLVSSFPPIRGKVDVVDERCEIVAYAKATVAAMVDLTLDASCMRNERVTVHHNGMMFTESTNAEGQLNLTMPALVDQAKFVFAFSNGEGAVAETHVEDMDQFDRVVVQWKGSAGLQLHAREFGAKDGTEGHVWSGARRDIIKALDDKVGFISVHGDTEAADPLLAEVYSFPVNTSPNFRGIDLTIEAKITKDNCDLEVNAQSLHVFSGDDVKTNELTIAAPGCEAVGNFLVLNNLLQDTIVAHK